jgi:hypothetical protein
MTPNRVTASTAYAEHDGTNLQDPANIGDRNSWYPRSSARTARWATVSVPFMTRASSAGPSCQPLGSPSPDALEILGDRRKGDIKELTARNHDRINAGRLTRRHVQPEHLSNQSLSSIPLDRSPELAGGHDAEAGNSAGSWPHQNREIPTVEPGATIERLLEVAAAPNALRLRKTRGPDRRLSCWQESPIAARERSGRIADDGKRRRA